MFRDLTRKKQQLSEEECLKLLRDTKRGVLSVNGDDGYPYGTPINHYYDDADGRIYFHGGKYGHKVDAMKRDDRVSFCVINDGERKGDDWFLTFESVIVFGRMELIEDPEIIAVQSEKLSRKFTDDDSYIRYEIERSGPGTLMYAMKIENICGKRVREK